MNYQRLEYEIWSPPFDYIIVGKPHNYIQKLRKKVRLLKASIRYVNFVLNDPEVSISAKKLIYVSQLLDYLKTQEIYEKTGFDSRSIKLLRRSLSYKTQIVIEGACCIY